MSDIKKFNLSDQALGAVMMALQKSLMEQSDIVPVLKDMDFVPTDHGLVVSNAPLVKFAADDTAMDDNSPIE
tara:strand:- start:3083 stop:3298 length:216 start_codon:yes stop_codon:yes gene_type:complete